MVYPTEHTQPEREAHPATISALNWIEAIPIPDRIRYVAKLTEMADGPQNSRIALSCVKTLSRLNQGQMVDEVDLLALAWILLQIKKGREV